MDEAAVRSLVSRNCAAKHNARFEVDARERLIENDTADIIEEYIDPIGAKRRKPPTNILTPVIDGAVEMRYLRKPITFFSTTGRADYAASIDLSDLAPQQFQP